MSLSCGKGFYPLLRSINLFKSLSSRAYSPILACTTSADLWTVYCESKARCESLPFAEPVNPKSVFANNELDLAEVDAYGFDYDYTLAIYKKNIYNVIYKSALKRLVDDYKYPAELAYIPVDPDFAIRGLHYDIKRGILMKLDAFDQIQFGTAHRGFLEVPAEELHKMYPGNSVANHTLESQAMKQLSDLFSLPEAGLLATATYYFMTNDMNYDSSALFCDVQAAIRDVHVSGSLYSSVMNDIPRNIHSNPGVKEYLQTLNAAKKTVFLITNSPYYFVNRGLQYILGNNWRSLFDYVLVQADKPRFFSDKDMPFRQLSEVSGRLSWETVRKIEKGKIYAKGNLDTFSEMTELKNSTGVLYFGDHIYSDLAEPMLRLGWCTGAIIPELEKEIQTQNDEKNQEILRWSLTLNALIQRHQDEARQTAEMREILQLWLNERDKLKYETKAEFNPRFGSMFRTHHNMTYFSRRLCRLADVYTSRLPNFSQYSLDYAFYPRRTPLPHENSKHRSFVDEYIYWAP